MMNQKIQDAFNGQVNAELFSAYLYLSMGAWAETKNLKGLTHWMRLQAQEELQHALKFYDFINERGGTVILTQIEAPQTQWASSVEAFADAYAHECEISGRIDRLVDLALQERDHAANAFLQWFVTEQVEEEATAVEALEKFKLAADSPGALFMLDRELAGRTIAAAPAADA